MIPEVLQRDIDNLVNSEQLWALATYLMNYAQEETGDTESVFFYALAKVAGRKKEGGLPE